MGRPFRIPILCSAFVLPVAAMGFSGCMVTQAAEGALRPDGPNAVGTLVDCAVTERGDEEDVALLFQLRSGKRWRVTSQGNGGRLTAAGPSSGPHGTHAIDGTVEPEEARLTPGTVACFSPEPPPTGGQQRSVRRGRYFPAGGGDSQSEDVSDEEWRKAVLVLLFDGEQRIQIRVPPREGRGAAGELDRVLGDFTVDRSDKPVLGSIAFAVVLPFALVADVVGFPIEAIVFLGKVSARD